jgi:hypothetical protein
VPTFGNGSVQHDIYAQQNGGYHKIWTGANRPTSVNRVISTTKLAIGRSAGTYMVPMTFGSALAGTVTPFQTFFDTAGTLGFYLDRDLGDQSLYAATSDANAAYIGTDITKLCVESVPVGQSPRFCNFAMKRGPSRIKWE